MVESYNVLRTLAIAVNVALIVYVWIIIIRALISWVHPDPNNPFIIFLNRITDPVLGLARRITPSTGRIDLSPLVAILVLIFIRMFLVGTLLLWADYGAGFQAIFILGIFIFSVTTLLRMLIHFLIIIIVIWAIISWVSPNPYNPIVLAIFAVVDPILRPLQKIIPPVGGFDITPIIAVLILLVVNYTVVRGLLVLAMLFLPAPYTYLNPILF
jgi:YggT family protein